MRDLESLRTAVLLSGQIEEKISRPSKQLVHDIVPESNDWGVLGKFCELDHVGLGTLSEIRLHPRFSRVWDESSVLINVAGCLVVLGVTDSPRVEGNEEERVHDQAHGVIELLVLGEPAMAALVCQNPDASEDETLDSGVRNPGRESKVGIGEQRDICDGEVDESREVEIIADDVCH